MSVGHGHRQADWGWSYIVQLVGEREEMCCATGVGDDTVRSAYPGKANQILTKFSKNQNGAEELLLEFLSDFAET